MTWTQTLRERWWLAPIAILLVAAAIVIRILTAPLEVSANVSDGEQSVPRTAAIDLHFNQDMNADSVKRSFTITPTAPVVEKSISTREFQFRPAMQPNTAYRVSLKGAQSASGRGQVTNAFSFKTEPAPTIADVKVDDQGRQRRAAGASSGGRREDRLFAADGGVEDGHQPERQTVRCDQDRLGR